jgi:hypothetical protein
LSQSFFFGFFYSFFMVFCHWLQKSFQVIL